MLQQKKKKMRQFNKMKKAVRETEGGNNITMSPTTAIRRREEDAIGEEHLLFRKTGGVLYLSFFGYNMKRCRFDTIT